MATTLRLKDVKKHLEEHSELKVRGIMGGGPADCHEITILGRRLSWRGDVMKYEADVKHAEMVCEEMGLEKTSKGLEKPCVREEAVEVVGNEEPLCPAEATRFRTTASRANFLALDRVDVQYAVKEVCRDK